MQFHGNSVKIFTENKFKFFLIISIGMFCILFIFYYIFSSKNDCRITAEKYRGVQNITLLTGSYRIFFRGFFEDGSVCDLSIEYNSLRYDDPDEFFENECVKEGGNLIAQSLKVRMGNYNQENKSIEFDVISILPYVSEEKLQEIDRYFKKHGEPNVKICS